MSDTKLLKPAPGLKVRRPGGARLDEAGEHVTMNAFWARRLAAGDVVEVAEAKPAAAEPKGRKAAPINSPE